MIVDDVRRPPLDALAGLTALAPDAASDRRVRARCHAALTRQPRRRAAAVARLLEAATLAAVGVYVAAIVTAALQLLAAG